MSVIQRLSVPRPVRCSHATYYESDMTLVSCSVRSTAPVICCPASFIVKHASSLEKNGEDPLVKVQLIAWNAICSEPTRCADSQSLILF